MHIPWKKSSYYCGFGEQQLTSLNLENHKQFCKAIQCRDIKSVQHFVQNGASVNSILQDGIHTFDPNQTPLHLAVISRCPEIVKILLDNGAKRNSRTFKNETPLIMAAKTQNAALIDLLLLNERDNFWDCDGLGHLHIACMRGNLVVAKRILLKHEGDFLNMPVDESSIYWPGFTHLHFAVHFEQYETVRFLLNHGANMMIEDTKEHTPLHMAHSQRNEGIIDLLLSAHKSYFTNPTDAEGLTHFHIACSRDDTSVVEHFLKFCSNIDSENEDGWKPIHFALYYECNRVIDLLSRTGNHLSFHDVPTILEQTYVLQNHIILSLSSTNRTVSDARSDDSRVRSEQLSEFYDACISDDVDEVQRLTRIGVIDNDFDLNLPIKSGCTPLHLAVRSKAERSAVVLLDHGANFMLQDTEGKTALHVAFELNLHQVIEKIFTNFHDQTPNLMDNKGLSVFHILCARDEQGAIEDFIRRGVDINCKVASESACWAGFAPIHFAIRYKKHHAVDILVRNGADISLKNDLDFDSLAYAFHRLHNVEPPNHNRMLEIINLILKFAEDGVENFDDRGISQLHVVCATCEDDNPDVIRQYLTSHPEYIDKPIQFSTGHKTYNTKTPLALAILQKNLRQALLLIENGADLFRVDEYGDDLLELAFKNGFFRRESIDAAENLFNIAIASMDKFKPSYFYNACISGLPNVVKSILENCAAEKLKAEFVNYRNNVGQTPLHNLLLRKMNKIPRGQIVKLLLDNGCDVNAQDYMLRTPLHCVKKATDLEVTRMLIEHGADVNAQNIFGQTPLHEMYVEFFEGYDRNISDHVSFRDQIILLLQSGFDIDIVDGNGRTCLMVVDSFLRTALGDDDPDDPIELDMARILMEHVRKLQIVELDVGQNNELSFRNLKYKNTTYNESVFDERCRQELDLMKSVKLDPRKTMFHVLTESLDNMAFYCENTILLDVVKSSDFVRFSNYGFLIKLQIKNGRVRRSSLRKSEEILNLLIGKLLPHECMEKILQYLTNAELRNVISSGADFI